MGNVDGCQQPSQYLQVVKFIKIARPPKEQHSKSANYGDLIVFQMVKIALKDKLVHHT